jgi:hypothetical protein
MPPHAQPGNERTADAGWRARLRRHPVITATFVVCTVAGALAGLQLGPEAWPTWRQLLAGAFSGAGVGLLVTATKMFG